MRITQCTLQYTCIRSVPHRKVSDFARRMRSTNSCRFFQVIAPLVFRLILGSDIPASVFSDISDNSPNKKASGGSN